MCHSNLILSDGKTYHERFPSRLRTVANRLFSLDQGSHSVGFPEGTGVPIMSDQAVMFNSQVLNHNVVGEPFDVRQKVSRRFRARCRPRETADPIGTARSVRTRF